MEPPRPVRTSPNRSVHVSPQWGELPLHLQHAEAVPAVLGRVRCVSALYPLRKSPCLTVVLQRSRPFLLGRDKATASLRQRGVRHEAWAPPGSVLVRRFDPRSGLALLVGGTVVI